MNENEISQMLATYHMDVENERVNAYFEKDNIWTILNVQRYEPSHSAFLVWYLKQSLTNSPHIKNLLHLLVSKANPSVLRNGWNATNDMHYFAESIQTGSFTIENVNVSSEKPINQISKIRYTDRIDVFIKCGLTLYTKDNEAQEKTLEIIIENKIDSPEGKEKNKELTTPSQAENHYQTLSQTNRYYYACSKENKNRTKDRDDVDYQLFVFLSPDGKNCESKNYIILTYQNLVDCLFEKFLERTDISENARYLVENYIHNLGNPFNKKNEIIAMSTEERNLLVNFFERNRTLFEATIDAMIKKSEADGDDVAIDAYKAVKEGLNTASARRFYSIKGQGKYKMYEVFEEYVKYKIFLHSQYSEIEKELTEWGLKRVVGLQKTSINTGSSKKSYITSKIGDTTYYITKQWGDKDNTNNFYIFRTKVNETYHDDFLIKQIP